MIKKTKPDWCDFAWDPVYGCLNKCDYCYARKMTDRSPEFGNFNHPHWVQENYEKEFPQNPSWIFVNSMSDVSQWDPFWTNAVLEKIAKYPQHRFIFLTKNYKYDTEIWAIPNCYLGYTITTNRDAVDYFTYAYKEDRCFVSIEPIHSAIETKYLKNADWIVIGAETGRRKGKIKPLRSWIDDIAIAYGGIKPIFCKRSLNNIHVAKLYKQMPEEI